MDDINKVLGFCGGIITMLSGAVGVLWRAYQKQIKANTNNVKESNQQDLKVFKVLSRLHPLIKENNDLIKSSKK